VSGKPQYRRLRRRQLVATLDRAEDVRPGDRRVDHGIVRAEVHGGPQRQPDRRIARQVVGDMRGVLQVRHQDAPLERQAGECVSPDRQAVLHRELLERGCRAERTEPLRLLDPCEAQAAPIGGRRLLGKVIQHHHAAEGRRQRGDEQPVVAPRHDPGDRAGGVPAQAVGHEPFTAKQPLDVVTLGGTVEAADQRHDTPSERSRLQATQHDRRFAGQSNALVGDDRRRAGTIVAGIFARPDRFPTHACRRREQRFRGDP